jgi:hypothetical protein
MVVFLWGIARHRLSGSGGPLGAVTDAAQHPALHDEMHGLEYEYMERREEEGSSTRLACSARPNDATLDECDRRF